MTIQKCAKTKANRFSVSASEILWMDNKELNQYDSLTKLAPYLEEECKLIKQKWKPAEDEDQSFKMRSATGAEATTLWFWLFLQLRCGRNYYLIGHIFP